MAGTPNALMPHTYEPDITKLTLNGTTVGEIGIEAAVAGDHEIPVLMITGDAAAVREAERLLPGITGVVVKQQTPETGVVCRPPSVTLEQIRSTAESIAADPPEVAPFTTMTADKTVADQMKRLDNAWTMV